LCNGNNASLAAALVTLGLQLIEQIHQEEEEARGS